MYFDTVLVRFPLYCPKCKKEIRVTVAQLKMVLSDGQTLKAQSLLPTDVRMQALFLFCGLFDLGSSVRSDRSQEGLDDRN